MLAVKWIGAVIFSLCAWINPQTSAKSHYLRGVELLRNQSPSEAIDELDAALKMEPQLAEAHHAKGLARLAQGNPAAAEHSEVSAPPA